MEVAYLVRVEGRVTGVGFRFSTVAKVNEFSTITGYVRNLREGQVEVVVQGKIEEIERMLEWLRCGPDWARVDRFSYSRIPIDSSYSQFRIK